MDEEIVQQQLISNQLLSTLPRPQNLIPRRQWEHILGGHVYFYRGFIFTIILPKTQHLQTCLNSATWGSSSGNKKRVSCLAQSDNKNVDMGFLCRRHTDSLWPHI